MNCIHTPAMVLLAGLFLLSACSAGADAEPATDGDDDLDSSLTDGDRPEQVSDGDLTPPDGDREEGELGETEEEACETPSFNAEIQGQPFALTLKYEDKKLVTLSGGEESAFFFLDRTGVEVKLQGPAERVESCAGVEYIYRITDERKARIMIMPADHGGVKLRFRIDDKDEGERLGLRMKVSPDEAFYGLMERVVQGNQNLSWEEGMTEALDLRGQEVDLFIRFTVSAYSPFFLSSAGYGVYVESDWPGTYRFGTKKDDQVEIDYEGPDLSLQLIPGPSPMEVTERYAMTVGPSILPPRWVFSPWRWRDDHYDLPEFYDGTPYDGPFNSMLVEDILMMEALGIPCSLYWVDRPWCPGDFGYDDLQWDENRLPQPVEMLQWLGSKDTEFMLWLAPWVMGDMRQESVDLGYDVPNTISSPFNAELIDMTNPEAVAWWQDHLMARIADGVRGFKLDRGEERVPDGLFVVGEYDDGTSYREGHNAFPRWYAAAVQGAFERAGVEEYVVMPRAFWVGSQRHAILWGGDTRGSEWGLRSAIIAVQRNAAMNFPIWGSDTCGYRYSPRKTCGRWLAFSAFTPLMEVGPTRNASLWSMLPEGESGEVGADGYPYKPEYDEELIAIWILYANIHQDLLEYTYAQAERAHEKGTPIVRPMIFAHPEKAEYKDMFDQYFFGPDILVAPVWLEDLAERTVSLPDGQWIDAWSGEEIQGPANPIVATPLHKMPIYIRKGADIDLGNLENRWQSALTKAAQVPDLAELVSNDPLLSGE